MYPAYPTGPFCIATASIFTSPLCFEFVWLRSFRFMSKLADQYFRRTLLKKVWRGWRAVVQKQWKEVVERACQARAEEVCVQISNDYEAKVALVDVFCFIFSFLRKKFKSWVAITHWRRNLFLQFHSLWCGFR